MNQRFFVFILAGFFGGVALRSFFPARPAGGDLGPETALLFLTLGFAFGIIFWFRQDFSGFMLYAAVFMAAFGLGILRYDLRDSREGVKFLEEGIGGRVVLSGEVIEDPQRQDKFTRAVLETDGVKILLTLPHYPEVKYGDILEVSGKLREPENFGEFDWKVYLAKDNIYFEMFLPEVLSREEGGGWFLKRWLLASKHAYLDNLSKVLPEPHSAFLAGLTVGERSGFPAALEEAFRKVGVIHIVVLSGYNITIIAVGIFCLMAYFGKRNLSFLLSIIFISLFAVMVGLSATVVRACIMAFIAILARFLGRPADALRWLFIAAILMLLWNPLILFYDPSFQLSFMATLVLILFSPFILSFISKHKFGKYIPTKFGLREIISSTLAVQFFVLPLLIKMSGFVSIISFIVNPLVLPLVPWAMAFGAMTGALGIAPSFLGVALSWPLGVISYFITQIIISITEFSAGIPFATLQTGSISLWLIFVWYLGYGVLYFKIKNKSVS